MSRNRDSVVSEDEEMEYDTPSSKRVKLDNGSSSNGSGSGSGSTDETTEDPTLKVDEDGFVEGSIYKITLTNFVTYDYCEIFPGPQMNMIIGPNGTGKSTIVCAIALGLGGAPSLLGRAKNIAEFVKTGEEEATITIELKKVGVRNVVIQRTFRKNDNTNTWRINGKAEPQREVLNTVRKLNIQVDNLCQFLPQDRVSEFAELTPPQLLERTQAATGETDLHNMQKQLMEWKNEEKSLEKNIHSTVDELKTLQTRNAELEKDVLRMQQRAEIMNNIQLLKAQIPLVKYSDAKKLTDELKQSALENRKIVDDVKAELAPIEEVIGTCEREVTELNRKHTEEGQKFRDQSNRLKEVSNKASKAREEIKANNAEIENIKRRIPEREREIEALKNRIRHLEEEVKEKPSGDISHIEEGIVEVNSELTQNSVRSGDLQRQIRETSNQKHLIMDSLKAKETELQEMNNVMHVRMNKLKQRYPDVYEAWAFCKKHKDKFRGKIHGPVALVINVKDNRYNAMVEQFLGGSRSGVLREFVCENQDDYRTFTRLLVDEKRLKINVACPDHISDNDVKTPCTTNELRERFGMEYFVSDLLEGDSHVIRYLCKDKKINLIPLALKHSREQDIVNSGKFVKFGVGDTFYNVKTALYGNRSKQTSTTIIRPAEFFSDSVDQEARAAVTDDIRTFQAKIQQADVVLKEYNAEHDQTKQKNMELKHKKEDLQAQKRDIQMSVQNYARKIKRIEQTKNELEEAKKSPEQLHKQIEILKEKAKSKKAEAELHLKNHLLTLTNYVDIFETRNIYKLQNIHAAGKLSTIRNYFTSQTTRLSEAQEALAKAKKQHQLAQREAQLYKRECETAGGDLEDHLRPKFQEILRKWKEEGTLETEESLETQIQELTGKVAGIRYANPNAMAHYEERKLEIERKAQKVEVAKKNVEKLQLKIAELRNVWEPRIDNLVQRISEKFSEAFARINCAGEVCVDKTGDFDKWGINIMVKFRETEQLQQLTATRQSGGERSVSTVLYLMSLQNLAKSPFRVVDEINQGMDPRNERMIHEQIVQGASKPGTSQYFLITPKLLPDLFYNERMRVLCIYNSEWLPTKIKPLTHYLEHAQATGCA